MNNNLKKVQTALTHYITDNGNTFSLTATQNDEIEMLTLIRDDIEEFAIIATASSNQILFNVALFDAGQVRDGKISELHQMMLELKELTSPVS